MKTRFKLFFTVLLLILSIGLVQVSFHQMNQPSDVRLYSGICLIVVLVVFFPAVISWIWRNKPNNEQQLQQR